MIFVSGAADILQRFPTVYTIDSLGTPGSNRKRACLHIAIQGALDEVHLVKRHSDEMGGGNEVK